MENPVSVPHLVHEVLRMPGEPLAPAIRSFFETFYGCNFTHVRVHADARASLSARMVNTRAYTVGRHIVFGDHGYQPFTPAGRKLLAHELAHVVQQGHGACLRLTEFPSAGGTTSSNVKLMSARAPRSRAGVCASPRGPAGQFCRDGLPIWIAKGTLRSGETLRDKLMSTSRARC